MGALFSYSLAASLITALMFPIIYWLVNHSTVFRLNRAAVLATVALAVLFPLLHFLNVTPTDDIEIGDITTTVQQSIDNSILTENNSTIIPYVIIAYLSMVVVLLIREAVSYIRF